MSKDGLSKVLGAVLVLGCICLGSGAGVGTLYWQMKDDIEEKARGVFEAALAQVLGEGGGYSTVGDYPEGTPEAEKVFVNRSGAAVLCAAKGTAQGYQSQIAVLVSVASEAPGALVGPDPRIHTMVVVESQETPGLGENVKTVQKDISLWGRLAGAREEGAAKRPWFQEQFSGKRLSDLVVEKRKDTDKIAALTGATITSRATTEAARRAVQKIIDKTAEANGE
ncbi:MAG: FMN-binding protein [Planctomycetota bacterium]|jgi:Na+-translocating ferredoxin:NAD+ oxidoreductase RnfG subunit